MQNGDADLASPFSFVCRARSGFLLLTLGRDLEQRRRAVEHTRLGDLDLGDVVAAPETEHDVRHELLENRAEAACAGTALERALRHTAERRLVEGDLHLFELEQLGVLL